MTEETRHEFLQIINEESDRLTNLINGILEISRIEAGTIEIIRKPVNMTSVISRAVADLEHLAGKKKIKLQIRYFRKSPRTARRRKQNPLDDYKPGQ